MIFRSGKYFMAKQLSVDAANLMLYALGNEMPRITADVWQALEAR